MLLHTVKLSFAIALIVKMHLYLKDTIWILKEAQLEPEWSLRNVWRQDMFLPVKPVRSPVRKSFFYPVEDVSISESFHCHGDNLWTGFKPCLQCTTASTSWVLDTRYCLHHQGKKKLPEFQEIQQIMGQT